MIEQHRNDLKEVKRLLFQLIDTIYLEQEYNTLDAKCRDFDFASTVINLAHEEQDYYMKRIADILRELLPYGNGLLDRLRAKVVFYRGREWTDHYPYILEVKGVEKECQEYYCLRKIFEDVDRQVTKKYYKKYWAVIICGYSDVFHSFYINIEV